MQILFVSNYFPPEVNAPATRLFEHASHWVREGHDVEVLTGTPNFPDGVLFAGYRNQLLYEVMAGIRVTRVPLFIAANRGYLRRTLSYFSFLASVLLHIGKIRGHPDVLVATSPQIFCAIAGYFVARRLKVPFVLEIRDLWPESIIAVQAMKRNVFIRLLEKIELFLYRHADHIVALTDSFKRYIESRGIAPERITVLKNGANLDLYGQEPDKAELARVRTEYGMDGQFVVSYIGTVGLAHGLDILLRAAKRCQGEPIVFLIVGSGADRKRLEKLVQEQGLDNLIFAGQQPKHRIPSILAASDACAVVLRATPLFQTVIPSKIFETMAMRRPILLGVDGEARAIVAEANAGICFHPEDDEALVRAVHRLRTDRSLYEELADCGYYFVRQNYDRKILAHRYAGILESVVERRNSVLRASRKKAAYESA